MAYTLALPPHSRIHPTFHVSLLKPKVGAHVVPFATLPPMSATGEVVWTPDQILQRGLCTCNNTNVELWHIKWRGLPTHDATWEDAVTILERFPDFSA